MQEPIFKKFSLVFNIKFERLQVVVSDLIPIPAFEIDDWDKEDCAFRPADLKSKFTWNYSWNAYLVYDINNDDWEVASPYHIEEYDEKKHKNKLHDNCLAKLKSMISLVNILEPELIEKFVK